MRRTAAICVGLCCLLGACGGAKTKPDAPLRTPAADKLAYLELARASGVLRASAAATALGQARQLGARDSLVAAEGLVAGLRPADRLLRELRGTVGRELAAALAASSGSSAQRVAARRATTATDAINSQLRRYAARRPQLATLIPD
ncbi:MAG: hypothetical protein NVSMB51_06760 [Solirubrobacteraceae bacterium]